MTKETIEILVEGGKASGGPPLGPKIGPMGLNINDVVAKINEATASFAGMKIPVKVIIDASTKEYDIEMGTPPTSALVKKEISLDKGTSKGEVAGNLTFEQLLKVADMKKTALLAEDPKAAAKEVIGTCQTLGVTIEGKSAKEITREINEGKYDDKF